VKQVPAKDTASAGGRRSWLDNRRPQSMAASTQQQEATYSINAASSPAAAAAAAAIASSPRTEPALPSMAAAQTAQISAGLTGSTVPAPRVPTVVAPAGTAPSRQISGASELAATESSFDFGDTLDGGLANEGIGSLSLSTGGLGLTSVVALVAPMPAAAAAAAAADGSSRFGPSSSVLPAPPSGV
jgi:hypothetical protein